MSRKRLSALLAAFPLVVACPSPEPKDDARDTAAPEDSGPPCAWETLSTFYADTDGDGFGDLSSSVVACEPPEGHVSDASDCDDGDALVHPGAEETCDRVDDDCDGLVDEDAVDASPYYVDRDNDGYGTVTTLIWSCTWPEGYAPEPTDCDDLDPSINPAASERCDGIDNDCDEEIDEDTSGGTWYVDEDGDGYGRSGGGVWSCTRPEGRVGVSGDCDDASPVTWPGAREACDGLDNDCDGLVDGEDEDLAENPPCFADADGDGYGSRERVVDACACPEGSVHLGGDCRDDDPTVHVGAVESCNARDDDCDGTVDESGAAGELLFYRDADGDRFGDPSDTAWGCLAPEGYTVLAGDCDDTNASVLPGAVETCDGRDEDCDGEIDEGAGEVWYADADGDGFGSSLEPMSSCEAPAGRVSAAGDCDDEDPTVRPGAFDRCDGLDNDCDGRVDDETSPVAFEGLSFACVAEGRFTMGSPPTELGREGDESTHLVEITRPFAVSLLEITQEQFESWMGYNPSSFASCGACPVETLSWHEAALFANLLSEAADLEPCYACDDTGESPICAFNLDPQSCEGFRMPTEAEWEYAARGGWSTAFANGGNLRVTGICVAGLELDNGRRLDEIAWTCGVSSGTTRTGGRLEPNSWGLYDMSGNAAEWCSDGYTSYGGGFLRDPVGSGSTRVVRGGGFDDLPEACRLAARRWADPEETAWNLGFRLAITGR